MQTQEDIMLAPPPPGVVVDPMAWFTSPGPFELEVGCGKGGFLLSRARANPHVRLLGIESVKIKTNATWLNFFRKVKEI